MNIEVQQVEYAADPHAIMRRVPIATLVREGGQFRLVEAELGAWAIGAPLATRKHVQLVLASLRNKIAHGAEPTPPSAQVFFRRVTGAEADALWVRVRGK